MPINKFEIIGSLNEPNNCWNSIDLKFINSKNYIERTIKKFEKCPFNFNFFLKLENKKIDVLKNGISIIYEHNSTSPVNYLPMTPWILIHRMAHGFQKNNSSKEFSKLNNYFFSNIDKISKLIFPTKQLLNNYKPLQIGNIPFVEISSSIMTMKSARNNKIDNSLDIIGELFAQFIFSKINFNRIDNWNPQELFNIYMPYINVFRNGNYQPVIFGWAGEREEKITALFANKKKINLIIDDMETNTPKLINDLFISLEGKTISF